MKRPTFYVVLPKFFWLALLLAIFIAAVSSQAVADPITSITHLNNFRDTRVPMMWELPRVTGTSFGAAQCPEWERR